MAKKSTYTPSNTRLYNIYNGIKQRCYSPNSDNYLNYGGKGIKMCDEWLNSFKAFEEWAYSHGYREYLTIDRKNNDGDYEPDNCRWLTIKEQQRNKSNNLIIEIDGVSKCFIEWVEISGIRAQTLFRRYKQGDRGKRLIRPIQWTTRPKKDSDNQNKTERNRTL